MDNELTRKYELMLVVDAKLNHEDKEGIFKEVVDLVNKSGGKVINSQVWLEKHKFTFEIKKCAEGTYYVINFEAVGEVISKIKSALKLNERVLRFATSKTDKQIAEPAKA